MRRAAPLLVLLLAAASCVHALSAAAAAAPAAAAPALPPQVVAPARDAARTTQAQLRVARVQLAAAARRQQLAVADRERTMVRLEPARSLLAALPFAVPSALTGLLDAAAASAQRDVRIAQVRLDRVTARTALVQAAALDADRRLRALQRAVQTTDDIDTSLGSWRFGSGGPAVSAATIDSYLSSKGSPLAGSGAAFLESGVRHEVDPRLLVAIAGAESYFGVTTCAPFNAWGWGCPSGPYRFSSWAHGIDTVARGIRTGYLDDGLDTVGTMHLRYAPPAASNDPTGLNYAWANNVARLLVEQGGDPQSLAGVLPRDR